MHVYLAGDHAGFDLKAAIAAHLTAAGHTVQDFGTTGTASCDYPDYVHPLALAVNAAPDTARGILVCGSGNGVCLTANKYPHVRAALVWLEELAALARQHNNANVLCLPARFIGQDIALKAVDAFLQTDFEGGRHQGRVGKIVSPELKAAWQNA